MRASRVSEGAASDSGISLVSQGGLHLPLSPGEGAKRRQVCEGEWAIGVTAVSLSWKGRPGATGKLASLQEPSPAETGHQQPSDPGGM